MFENIRGGYENKPSIFDDIGEDDLVLAFFPCTRFEARIPLWFRGEAQQQKNWTEEQKMEYAMDLHQELHEFYLLISKMVLIAKRKNLRMVIENPFMQPHYLTIYWCLRPTIVDHDRTENGDYYKKPTQYWFINLEPKCNLNSDFYWVTEEKKIVGDEHGIDRSLISPYYVENFIKSYIL